MSRVADSSCKIVTKDIARTMQRVANTSSMIVVKSTQTTHKLLMHNQIYIYCKYLFSIIIAIIITIIS